MTILAPTFPSLTSLSYSYVLSFTPLRIGLARRQVNHLSLQKLDFPGNAVIIHSRAVISHVGHL